MSEQGGKGEKGMSKLLNACQESSANVGEVQQGHGCRYCESRKDCLSPAERENPPLIYFGVTKFIQRLWRCDMCGAYWGQSSVWDGVRRIYVDSWLCFGRDSEDIEWHCDTSPVKRKWYGVDWAAIGIASSTLIVVLYIFFYLCLKK
jgi:hypothetical protein